jgi:hypothetical protein
MVTLYHFFFLVYMLWSSDISSDLGDWLIIASFTENRSRVDVKWISGRHQDSGCLCICLRLLINHGTSYFEE